MAKYFGHVGFVETVEKNPGVWKEDIVERTYSGDVIRNTYRWQTNSNSTNDDIGVSNQISILVDPYGYENFHKIRYIVWNNVKWKVSSIDVQYPRLILDLGGVYNGDTGPSY